ncbi:MAG: RidA family protein [Burkholderiaceae bacterium]
MTRQPAQAGAFRPYVVTPVGTGKLIHISGLTSGAEAPFDLTAQAELIFGKLEAILKAEGGDLASLVKINAYIVDMREYDDYNAVRNRRFAGIVNLPASATIGGAQLVRPANRIEIDGTAFIASSGG